MTLCGPTRLILRLIASFYIFGLLVVPLGAILWRAFEPGVGEFIASISTPAAQSALQLSLLVVAIVVPLNVIFGVPTAIVLARRKFRGKNALQAVIDLPFAVSPVVIGVALIVLWKKGKSGGGRPTGGRPSSGRPSSGRPAPRPSSSSSARRPSSGSYGSGPRKPTGTKSYRDRNNF